MLRYDCWSLAKLVQISVELEYVALQTQHGELIRCTAGDSDILICSAALTQERYGSSLGRGKQVHPLFV